ncbi:hypothetical protein DFQ11_1244 [Winogradskyella epiphytica]|uniref:Uncharacterized protein n=1 Tax=Winogradskyella epiphytica TaxID=262005 RepID=A0A2V4XBT4_9FLAO|nr:hypothetical protein [Winogradskyella epiphytica]PYE78636.1 hypothetical protein DFQ11_1244 [Winogradskyella epiphytica]GGW75441.1 hypothetical protein GCM10008085_29110 [Winogradskyella epiphytica]
MKIYILEALIYSIIPTLIVLYITEKVKGNVKNNFDKKLEQLKKDHNIEITKFQAEISALKAQENFKFTKLHEKRLIVLENIYKLLNVTSKELSVYVSPIKFTPENIQYEDYENNQQINYVNAHNNFVSFFNDNKIYLNENVIELIDNYLNAMSEIYNDYSTNHILKNMGDNSNAEIRIKAITAYKKMPEKVNPIKKEIENKFKEILEK